MADNKLPDDTILDIALGILPIPKGCKLALREIKKQADEIAIENLLALVRTDGSNVDHRLRPLLGAWLEQHRSSGQGRPDGLTKASVIAFYARDEILRRPTEQRKSIYADVESKFGINRRRLLQILKDYGD
jgi:hypothetical protein